jgi:ABC-type nitrate/sulfonate/bicarbonate transport system permease component
MLDHPVGRLIPVTAATLLLLVVMEIAGRVGDGLIIPPATKVFAALFDLIRTGLLPSAVLESLQLLASGLVAAIVIGTVLGFVIGRSRRVDGVLAPYISGLYATPEIALVPVLIVWFGFDFPGRFTIVFLSAVFPMIYNVSTGVRTAPQDLEDMARSFVIPKRLTYLRVVFPSSLPFVIAGLRQAIGRAIVGMIVAEAYLRLGGLGALITLFGARFATDYLIAAIIVLPALGLLLTKLLDLAERRFAPWSVR